MEVILQHRETGLFLGDDGVWAERSRDALIFASAAEALRFAEASGSGRLLRLVVRVQRDTHYVLMPLLDATDDARPARRAA
jgi:hypothetical protein